MNLTLDYTPLFFGNGNSQYALGVVGFHFSGVGRAGQGQYPLKFANKTLLVTVLTSPYFLLILTGRQYIPILLYVSIISFPHQPIDYTER